MPVLRAFGASISSARRNPALGSDMLASVLGFHRKGAHDALPYLNSRPNAHSVANKARLYPFALAAAHMSGVLHTRLRVRCL